MQVNLYRDGSGPTNLPDKIIDDIDGSGAVELADVDNWPFGWRDAPTAIGPEDVDRNGNGVYDIGDALQVVTTDSWDDSVPTGCQGEIFYANPDIDPATGLAIPGTGTPTDCYDGLRNFNQVRPGVFEGNQLPAGLFLAGFGSRAG